VTAVLSAWPGALRGALVACLLLQVADVAAQADPEVPKEEAGARAFKLTVGWYRFSDASDAGDVNLRHSSDLGNLWAGYSRQPEQDVSQWRGGWDRSFGDDVRIQPSIQFASGGFVGGSIGVEAGSPWFAGAGLGRTNLRPYYNLNFDPNDSWVLTAGRRSEDGQVLMVTMVRDNRENPDQRHVHLAWRQPIAGGERLTLDALWKKGLVDDEMIQRWGFTATYDWPAFFVRLAWDPNANFTPQDMWRLSVGTRF
jgi:hypothetical protein